MGQVIDEAVRDVLAWEIVKLREELEISRRWSSRWKEAATRKEHSLTMNELTPAQSDHGQGAMGVAVATCGYIRAVEKNFPEPEDSAKYTKGTLLRFARNDWGDLCEEDAAAQSGDTDLRMGVYRLPDGTVFWVHHTPWEGTTLLLHEEY